MSNKNILGLDLGTNSIGWAVVKCIDNEDTERKLIGLVDAGSRIIPMDAAMQSDFAKGNTVSQTKERTQYRSVRRIRERHLLRRDRLHRVLSLMGMLPRHYAQALTRYGKFKDDVECRLPWAEGSEGMPVFIFQQSYDEMLQIFWQEHPELMAKGMKVPYDWTLYYLRRKALHQAISGEELSWILLNFNQKRGYYQARGEEDDVDTSKEEKYYALKVVDVVDSGDKRGKDTWYNVFLENGLVYRRSAKEKPDWVGKVKDFIVTTQLNEDGTPKKGKDSEVKRSISMPKEENWGLLKIKTEDDIRSSGLSVGEYIFGALLRNPKQKIKGQLVRTIERTFYKEELRGILEKQREYIPQLRDAALYEACINELYPQNDAYRQSIASKGFTYLLLDNIIFYQRPLKSKKFMIDECPYEYHEFLDVNGEKMKKYVKCIAKSHPLYQEFRLWQFVSNLRIYQCSIDDEDVTSQFLPDEESRACLFDWLNDRDSIKEEILLTKYFGLKKPKGKNVVLPYRWNYVRDKSYPCNETRGKILERLSKNGVDTSFLDVENKNEKNVEEGLWHILYSVNDPEQLRRALRTFAQKCVAKRCTLNQSVNDEAMPDGDAAWINAFVDAMVKFPPFENGYGAYSAKAVKKLLSLMRMGHHWRADDIDEKTRSRIQKLIDGEFDESIRERVREKAIYLDRLEKFRGLPLWLACYVVYNRHSEASDLSRWQTPDDIDAYLKSFKQHSLRNPVVEQVVTETLRTVRDIWRKYGSIDEIHVELGRELKAPADQRAQMTERALQGENTNLRIKALLTEFLNPELGIENVRPFSPSQQELLRIYEDTALNSVSEPDDYVTEIITKFADAKKRPTLSEVKRYALWLEQHYVSPYTGETIPLARLFTTDYEIEHVIPQSRYFDDSLSNKVICEAEVNKLKGNALGFEFIKQHHGEKVILNGGRVVTILETDSYSDLVNNVYGKSNRAKMRKLFLEDIPAEFIERQMNDSRYISKMVTSLLSHIVREEGEEEAKSKHIVVCTGAVTDRLKRDWGVNDVWNRIILPRFERMNEITNTQKFTTISTSGHLIPAMPLELQRGFSKKRIDHRHHAMDAIVIACATRDHVNLLSNEAALPKNQANRYQLSRKLRRYEDVLVCREGRSRKISVAKEFLLPWPTFTTDVEHALRQILVSFKQNLRVITKATNHTLRIVNGKKISVPQTLGDSWAIRKSMHKETVFGEINLRRTKTFGLKQALQLPRRIVNRDLRGKIMQLLELKYTEKQIKAYFSENAEAWSDVNLKQIEMYYFTKETSDCFFATRKSIDTSFNRKAINEKVADTAIQKIMLRHLKQYADDATLAFSPDGIDQMNSNILALNDGKYHQPIYKVRVYEKAEKFAVGQKGNKSRKFVEAAKGTNLFFAIYEQKTVDPATGLSVKKRSYRTIPLNEAILKMKQGLPLDSKASFILSPGDLVYVPTKEERQTGQMESPINKERVYKMVSSGKGQVDFVPYSAASVIFSVSKENSSHYSGIQNEFGVGSPKSKNERALTGEMIKEVCLPIKVDRLGHLIEK